MEVVTVAVTGVTTVCPAVRFGDAGANEHAPPVGRPVQASVTAPDKVLLGCKLNDVVPVSVPLRLRLVGDNALMVKSGAG